MSKEFDACREPLLRIAHALKAFETLFFGDMGKEIADAAREIERALEPEKPKTREPGWYWVMTGTGWQPLEWTSNGWYAGDDEWWEDDALGGVDEQRIVRGQPE